MRAFLCSEMVGCIEYMNNTVIGNLMVMYGFEWI